MKPAHRLTTIQLAAFLAASAVTGASAMFLLDRSVPARAEAAAAAQGQHTAAAPAPPGKKKAGRPVVHFEIGCRDSAKTRDFYTKLFDWQIKTAGAASEIHTGAGRGIDGHITSLGHEPQNYIAFYVEVDDLKTYLDKAAALGGKTLVPPIKIPTGRFAWFADPDGNIIALIEPKKP